MMLNSIDGSKHQSFIALSIKSLSVLLCLLIIYWQDFKILANEAINNELTNYILIVPFLITYIIYRKKNILITVASSRRKDDPVTSGEVSGLILFVLAFFLYWHGSYTFNTLEMHIIVLPIFISSLILLLFNFNTLKELTFSILLTIFLIPPPLEMLYTLGSVFSNFSSKAAYSLLKILGLPVVLSKINEAPLISIIEKSGTLIPFAIEISCSGIYSLIGFSVFAVYVSYITRGYLWKRIAVSLFGLPLMYLLNVIRITLIILIGFWYGPDAAMETFHNVGGIVLILIGSTVLLTLENKILKSDTPLGVSDNDPCSHCDYYWTHNQLFCPSCGKVLRIPAIYISRVELGKIASLIIFAYLLTSVAFPIFALTQGPLEINIRSTQGEETTSILPTIPQYNTTFLYRDTSFEELYGQDAALLYAYIPTNYYDTPIFVSFEISTVIGRLHRWEECYSMSSMIGVVKIIGMRDTLVSQDPHIVGRFLQVDQINSSTTQNILYWYTRSTFDVGSQLDSKFVKISVISYDNKTSAETTEKNLSSLGKKIIDHWSLFEFSSPYTIYWMEITRQRTPIILALASLFSITSIYNILKEWRNRKLNLKTYNRLLDEEKLILKAAYQAKIEGRSTTNIICTTYQRMSGKMIEHDMLIQKLRHAEELGLVQRIITNHNDDPIMEWKTMIPI